MIIYDTMVVIHLAKMTLLEKSCEHFKPVMIPESVYQEILAGEATGHPDVEIVRGLVAHRTLHVKPVKRKSFTKRARMFNIEEGEAESLALYWQERASYLASDDNNVRRKQAALDVRLIGTPTLLLTLYQEQVIDKAKLLQSLDGLQRIGWFSPVVLDKIRLEVR